MKKQWKKLKEYLTDELKDAREFAEDYQKALRDIRPLRNSTLLDDESTVQLKKICENLENKIMETSMQTTIFKEILNIMDYMEKNDDI